MRLLACGVLAALVCSFIGTAAQVPPVDALLTQARAAIGDEATLSGLSAFRIRGSSTRRLGGRSLPSSIEINCVLPAQFVEIERRSLSRGPLGDVLITDYHGFNGDEPFRQTVAPGLPIPPVIAGPEPATPEEVARAKARQLDSHRRDFVALYLLMLAASPEAYPVTFSPAGRVELPSGPADVLDVDAQTGFRWRLFLDAATHLPVRLTWQGRPTAMVSVSSTVAVSPSGDVRPIGAPPPPLPADPTAGMPDVEWALEVTEHRETDGVVWPRRLRKTAGGELQEELQFRNYDLNPRIDEKVFAVKRF